MTGETEEAPAASISRLQTARELAAERLLCLSGARPMTPYIFGNAAEAETAERFASLDALYNFRTFRFLETAGIGPDWHCLEVGGGSGAVAAWMADRVGPSGYVLVTDTDPRFMEGSAYRGPAHMELRRHDIGTDPLPEAAFDLIDARLVLCHVPQRLEALNRLVAALKPRGWLVIEEFDGRVIDRTVPVSDAAAAASFKRAGGALVRLLEDRGFEVEWGRRLYGRLKAAGLAEVGMEGHVAVCAGGNQSFDWVVAGDPSSMIRVLHRSGRECWGPTSEALAKARA
jgi:ubiquinone/menaquinone biosynthesis C-methylase UbiE